jgi:hypothetical protein
MVNETNFKWLKGTNFITHWKKDSGFTSDFCKCCGSPVPNRLRETGYFWIPMGLIDKSKAKVVAHICCESKADWDFEDRDYSVYEGMPENVDSFISSLQSR